MKIRERWSDLASDRREYHNPPRPIPRERPAWLDRLEERRGRRGFARAWYMIEEAQRRELEERRAFWGINRAGAIEISSAEPLTVERLEAIVASLERGELEPEVRIVPGLSPEEARHNIRPDESTT